MELTIESKVKLNQGTEIPYFGLGVFQCTAGHETKNAVTYAFEAGYRNIDTARFYGNEKSIGEAVRENGIPRSEIFITTKLWNSDHGYESALRAFDKSFSALDIDYIDLYLVHWPVQGLRLDSWRAMEKLLEDGRCKAIGVSNYMVPHLEELFDHCEIKPAVNQIELSPFNYLSRKAVCDFCTENGIVLEAYSPLTKGKKLNDPNLKRIAEKYNKTTAQVLIRWALQKNFVVIPKSSRKERIYENADVFDFNISEEDMDFLDNLDENLMTSWDPTDAP